MTKDEVIDLIKDAGYCVLATAEGDQPRARPMMPYLGEDGDMYLACLGSCRTVSQVQVNPKVELCYIDRKMSFARISGHGSVCEDLEKKELVWNNIPMLRQYFSGPLDPDFNLIKIQTMSVEAMTTHSPSPEVLSLKKM